MTKQFGQASRTTQLVPSGLYNLVAGQYGQYPQGGHIGVLRPQATGSKPVSAAPVHFLASALAQTHTAAAGPVPMQETNLGAQGHLNT
jgi:hypothetical protein